MYIRTYMCIYVRTCVSVSVLSPEIRCLLVLWISSNKSLEWPATVTLNSSNPATLGTCCIMLVIPGIVLDSLAYQNYVSII